MSIRRLSPVLLVFCALFLAGCAAARLGVPSAESVNLLATPQLQAEADKAFAKRDWARSELYYDRLLARAALDAWAKADKKALDDWQWHDLNIRSLAALGKQAGLEEQRAWLAGRKDVPWDVRERSALAFFDVFFAAGNERQALQALGDGYRLAPDATSRAALEQEFQARVSRLGDRDLKRLAQAAPPETRSAFPSALVEFELARRASKDKEDWAENWRAMRSVLAASQLESKDVLGRELRELEKKRGVPRSGVALALPLSGRFAEVGQKIARGAAVAQWALANAGQDVEVRVVNTDAPGWPGRLGGLPGHFHVVGGPVQTESLKEMEAAGLNSRRAFFAFVPSLGDLREGSQAWRFFPSARDQARAAASLAVDSLGIRNVAVLAPEEKFGRLMAGLFTEEVAARGGRVVATESYPPADHPEWGKSVARLLRVPFKSSGGIAPRADFGAVYLPDGWSQAQALIPNFFFHESSYLVFLGPEMWSRALDESRDLEEQYYRITACPGAWSAETAAAKTLQAALDEHGLGAADFWVAQGHDFVRFALALGLSEGAGAGEVNARLSQMSGFDYSLAPFSWSADGQARQELYLFQPAKDGKITADPAQMRENISRALARRERWIRNANTKQQPKPAAAPTAPAAPEGGRTVPGELDRD